MANTNEPKLRNNDHPDSPTKHVPGQPVTDVKHELLGNDGDGHPSSNEPHPERSDEREPTPAELRAAELEEIDATEISQDHTTSTVYRRAFSDYDPEITDEQICEHWVYRDAEYERDGNF